MRLRTLTCALAALALAAPAAAAADGGATAPVGGGGTQFGTPIGEPGPPGRRPTIRFFHATRRARVGTALHFAYRVDGGGRSVDVTVEVARAGEDRPRWRLRLGRKPTRTRHVHRWAASGGPLPAGRYVARLRVKDRYGRKGATSSRASIRDRIHILPPAPPPPPVAPSPGAVAGGVFPVRGPHSYGGDGSRFGAERPGHIHQGQDIAAAEGTPLVSPVAGTVYWRAYQARGAGHYLVIAGDDGRHYVLMHLQSPASVAKGARVGAGQRIGAVGSTGVGTGPHLHFEIWVGGWVDTRGRPIDPLPELRAWDR